MLYHFCFCPSPAPFIGTSFARFSSEEGLEQQFSLWFMRFIRLWTTSVIRAKYFHFQCGVKLIIFSWFFFLSSIFLLFYIRVYIYMYYLFWFMTTFDPAVYQFFVFSWRSCFFSIVYQFSVWFIFGGYFLAYAWLGFYKVLFFV